VTDTAFQQRADDALIRYGGRFMPMEIVRASGTCVYDSAGRKSSISRRVR